MTTLTTAAVPALSAGAGGKWLLLAATAIACALYGPRCGSPGVIEMAALLLAALVSSVAGFAFSAVAGAMLFHLDAQAARVVQVMITCSIANQVAMTWALRRGIDWRRLGACLAGGLAGLPLGVWLLLAADRRHYMLALGLLLLAFGGWMLVRPAVRLRLRHPAIDALVGVLCGISGGAAGFPSAALTVWCGLTGMEKGRQRALCQPFILLMQIAALLAIGLARGHQTPGLAATGFAAGDMFCVPASLLGTAVGMRLYHRLSERMFGRAVNLLLLVSGVSYVV